MTVLDPVRRLTLLLCAFVAAGLFTIAPGVAAEPRKILFVDTGNTGRSLSAEALARAIIAKRKLTFAVISRGVDVDPFDAGPEVPAAALLRARGIDLSGHVAAQMTANDARHADVILTMTAKHRDRVIAMFPEAGGRTFTLAGYATGTEADVADCWGKPMAAYVAMIAALDGYLPQALDRAAAGK